MAKRVAPLTVAQIKAAAAGRRLADGQGLYLEIRDGGAGKYPYALFRYQAADGKRREYGIGVLDTGIAASRGGLSLAEARDRAAALHRTVRTGNDPVADRRQEKLARIAAALATQEVPTLADALKRYIEKESPAWTSTRYTLGWARAVEDHAGKLLKLRVGTITHQMVAKALERSWVAAPVTARKVRSRVEAILTYATAQGWRNGNNPAALAMIRDLMPKVEKAKTEVQHMAAAQWQEIGEIMVKLARVDTVGAAAARFAILTAARAEEVRGLRWVELDTSPLRTVVLTDEDGAEYRDTTGASWIVPATRMKARREHRVPLSPEVLAILAAQRALYPDAKPTDLIFPSRTGKAQLDIGAQRYALATAGYGHLSMHGMRSTFRNWVGEATSYDVTLAEFALAHRVHGATVRAYARGTLFQKRRELMDAWARFATRPLKQAEGENVVALRQATG